MKPVVGLIGGIGSGKSAAAAAFARRGARVVNADHAGHEALRQPDIKARVVAHFGDRVLGPDGAVDRHKVAAIVFADTAELRALEAIVFPWIERRLSEEIEAARRDPAVRLVLLDAAILLEAGWDRVCDRLVFVDAPRELRLRRVAEQRGWSEKEVDARERAQWPLAEKARRALFTLDNSGSREQLDTQVEALLRAWDLTDEAPAGAEKSSDRSSGFSAGGAL